jgi:hypothetical protein
MTDVGGDDRQVIIVTSPAPEGPSSRPIGVFLLDDHEIVRRGVRELLEADPDIRVVGEAGTVALALARAFGAHIRFTFIGQFEVLGLNPVEAELVSPVE